MKTFVIVKKEDLSIQGSYLAEAKDDTSTNRSRLLAEPICAHIELPEGLDLDTVLPFQIGNIITLEVDQTKLEEKIIRQKQAQIEAAYNEMNSDILEEMANIFGTTRTDSATAYKETWAMMAQTPSDWSGAGLRASFTIAGLQEGEALDTNEKVLAYAEAKLAQIKAYGIWRMQRIEQFKSDRAAILAQ